MTNKQVREKLADGLLNMVWAAEAGVAIFIREADREDRRIVEIWKDGTIQAAATVERHNRDNLAESISTGDLRYSSDEAARLVRAALSSRDAETDKARADGYNIGFKHGQQSIARDAEMREVLEGLMTRRWFGDKPTACWCDPRAYPDSDDDEDQDARCRRTRALWAKLQTDQINGASSTPKG